MHVRIRSQMLVSLVCTFAYPGEYGYHFSIEVDRRIKTQSFNQLYQLLVFLGAVWATRKPGLAYPNQPFTTEDWDKFIIFRDIQHHIVFLQLQL